MNILELVLWRLEQLSSTQQCSLLHGAQGKLLQFIRCKSKAAATRTHHEITGLEAVAKQGLRNNERRRAWICSTTASEEMQMHAASTACWGPQVYCKRRENYMTQPSLFRKSFSEPQLACGMLLVRRAEDSHCRFPHTEVSRERCFRRCLQALVA